MESPQTTIKDIARALNISPSTVSRALKNHPDISKETKRVVLEMAEKFDYQPNIVALSLRKSTSFMLGIVIPKIVHHFFSTVISGIEDVVNEKGYRIIIAQSNEDSKKESDCVHTLAASRVDGIFMSLASQGENHTHLTHIKKRNIPLIFFDRNLETIEASSVVINDYEGAFQATEHLIFQGRKNILHLAGPKGLKITENRINGYKNALAKHHIEIKEELIIPCDNSKTAKETIKNLLENNLFFDGIFAVNDDTAIGAMMMLKQYNKQIPKDVAIIGFGDDPMAEVVSPSLSSVSQSGFEMGRAVANIFLSELEKKQKGQTIEYTTQIIPTHLVIRESSQ
ncbi:MAG: LacI family transcriptional regulator [Bacteroidetes bacterium]|nr:MAG: LacI family transcriptional regulator [Bacteroidota bacterium]TAG94734.1 MAG: LacI family transcriptional regulator [Bacteroidota bacterium]